MNSRLYEDPSEDNINPPIFTPSHNNDSSNSNVPPSFTPKRVKRGKIESNALPSQDQHRAQVLFHKCVFQQL